MPLSILAFACALELNQIGGQLQPIAQASMCTIKGNEVHKQLFIADLPYLFDQEIEQWPCDVISLMLDKKPHHCV